MSPLESNANALSATRKPVFTVAPIDDDDPPGNPRRHPVWADVPEAQWNWPLYTSDPADDLTPVFLCWDSSMQ